MGDEVMRIAGTDRRVPRQPVSVPEAWVQCARSTTTLGPEAGISQRSGRFPEGWTPLPAHDTVITDGVSTSQEDGAVPPGHHMFLHFRDGPLSSYNPCGPFPLMYGPFTDVR